MSDDELNRHLRDILDIDRKTSFAAARDRLRLAVDAAVREERESWQPIETAPKDGTEILAVTTYAGEPYIDVVSFAHPYWIRSNRYACRPTHWMPLPKPPAAIRGTTS